MGSSASTPADSTIGSLVLDDYRVTSRLKHEARGGSYLGRVVASNAAVVLRCVPGEALATGPRAARSAPWSFADRLKGVDHPNVERVLACGVARVCDEDQFCAVAEALEGDDLYAYVRDAGRLEVADALMIGRQIAQALGALHRVSVVHGDLRASCVVMVRTASNDGASARAVVCEAGLSSLALQSRSDHRPLRGMIGSPESIAPEQIRGEATTRASDIYAFGTVLYRMLTGAAAFHGDNTSQRLRAHLTQSVPPMRGRAGCSEIPASVEALVRRCLERRPEDRYESIDALLAGLQECEATVLSIASNNRTSWVAPPPSGVPGAKSARVSEPRASFPRRPSQDRAEQPAQTPSDKPNPLVARPSPVTAAAPVARPRPRGTTLLAVAAALIAVLASAWFASRRASHGRPAGAALEAGSRAPVAASRGPVRFEVRSLTPDVQCLIRGRTYPAPIEVELAPGSEPEMVEVNAPGYAPRRVWLVVDRSMSVQMDLEAAAR